MNNPYLAPALASLFAVAFPAQAQQTGMEAFNPMTFLAPIMTPLGAMMVPMTAPMTTPMAAPNAFNPAALLNAAQLQNLFNPALLQALFAQQSAFAVPATMPAGMPVFPGVQAAPQMANPFAGMMQYPQMQQPVQAAYPPNYAPSYPALNGFPFAIPGFTNGPR